MGVFSRIKEIKDEFREKKRAKTHQQLKDAQAELKLVTTKNKVISEDRKAVQSLRQTRKDLFEAKHPILSGALKGASKKIKENKAKNKGIFAQNTENPFLPKNIKKKGKGPGEGIFY